MRVPYSQLTWEEKLRLEEHDRRAAAHAALQASHKGRLPTDGKGRVSNAVPVDSFMPEAPHLTTEVRPWPTVTVCGRSLRRRAEWAVYRVS
jgi:hypothetical protein